MGIQKEWKKKIAAKLCWLQPLLCLHPSYCSIPIFLLNDSSSHLQITPVSDVYRSSLSVTTGHRHFHSTEELVQTSPMPSSLLNVIVFSSLWNLSFLSKLCAIGLSLCPPLKTLFSLELLVKCLFDQVSSWIFPHPSHHRFSVSISFYPAFKCGHFSGWKSRLSFT